MLVSRLLLQPPDRDSFDVARRHPLRFHLIRTADELIRMQTNPAELRRWQARDHSMKVWPGNPYPLGAIGTAQALISLCFLKHATGVDSAWLIANQGRRATASRMTEQTAQVWHVYFPEPGRRSSIYGYRVQRPLLILPKVHRFNPASCSGSFRQVHCGFDQMERRALRLYDRTSGRRLIER